MRKRPLLIILIAYFGFVQLGLWDGMFGVAWPSIRSTFDLPIDALGLLVLFGTLGYTTASSLSGKIIKLRGLAFVLLLSAMLAAIGRFSQTITISWPLWLCFSLIPGFAAGLIDAGLNTYAAVNFRPRLLNWLHASFALGTTIGSVVMTIIVSNEVGWPLGFVIAGGLQLVLLLVFFLTRHWWVLEGEADDATKEVVKQADSAETLRLPQLWLSAFVFFLYTGIEITVGHLNFTLLTEARGFSQEFAGSASSIYWGSFLAGRVILGFIETNTTRLIRLAMLGMVLGTVILWMNPFQLANPLALAMIGFSVAPIFPGLIALTPSRLGQKHAANAIGYQIAAAGVGAAILPSLGGVVAERISIEAVTVFFIIVAVGLFFTHESLARLSIAKKTASVF